MKLQHHEMVLQQEINNSDLENANKLSKNEIQTLNNRISLLEKENSILDQNIHKKCELITNLEDKILCTKKQIVDKEEEIISLKLHVGSLSSNNNPEEPFLTIPSKGKGPKPEPTQENRTSNDSEKQKTKVDKKKTVHLIGTSNIKFINPKEIASDKTYVKKSVQFEIEKAELCCNIEL